jgi:hypothetical protein
MPVFELTGPRGDNPLGFLAALGALVTLEDRGWRPRLRWSGLKPELHVEADASLEAMDLDGRRRRLIAEVESALRRDSSEDPDPSVRLGDNLNKSNSELLAHLDSAVNQAGPSDRRWVDLATAYGLADPSEPDERMTATPWALVTGGGHQHFLGSVRQLMVLCSAAHFERALFGPWVAEDQLYSLRLDSAEDRRYALLDRDPTAAGNKPRTLWGANRLAFEALRLFPAMPSRRGMAVRGWRAREGNWRDRCAVRWPLWAPPVSAAVIGSLLGLEEIWSEAPEARHRLRGMGVFAVYESRRVAVGEGGNVKYNLTPPVAIWRE